MPRAIVAAHHSKNNDCRLRPSACVARCTVRLLVSRQLVVPITSGSDSTSPGVGPMVSSPLKLT